MDEDWSIVGAQRQHLAPAALVVLDGEAAITTLAQRPWPTVPIQRCSWHLHLRQRLRKAFSADDAANRHLNPRWATQISKAFGQLPREQIAPRAFDRRGAGRRRRVHRRHPGRPGQCPRLS